MARTLVSTALTLAALLPAGASAGASDAPVLSGVSVASGSVAAGTPVSVSGTMTVAPQPAAVLWTDPTIAGDLPSFDYPTEPLIDIVEGSVVRARPGDPLSLRFKVAPALGPEAAKPFMWFRWPFHLDQIWYFIEFTYVQDGAAGAWQGSWYYCKLALGTNCIHGTTPPFPVTFDAATRTFTGQIPLAAMAAVQPDGHLVQDSMRPFSSQYMPESGHKYPALTLSQDNSAPFEPYDLPIETVFLGVAPVGTDPADVTYDRHAATTGAAGSLEQPFQGSVPTDGLAPGYYQLFVKGCFGPCTTTILPFHVA